LPLGANFMILTPLKPERNAFPSELFRYSREVEAKRIQKGSPPSIIPKDHGDSNAFAQLMPLNYRDIHALADLFEQGDMNEIESNIDQMLLSIYPEPCWDDSLGDFLTEFL